MNPIKQIETASDWDLYFLRIAREVSKHSKCLSRKIGAVLVRDKSIISTGYNGPARGVRHCNERTYSLYNKLEEGFSDTRCLSGTHDCPLGCPRKDYHYLSGKGLHLCQAGHAERNALIQAARNGISTLDATLYCFCGQVCKDCAIEIVNAGVRELVFLSDPDIHPYDNYSGAILNESGIIVRTVSRKLVEEGYETRKEQAC